MAVESKMRLCDDVETKFDRTFKSCLCYAKSNRGNASKELIDVVCRGNFFILYAGVIVLAFGSRESPGSVTTGLGVFRQTLTEINRSNTNKGC